MNATFCFPGEIPTIRFLAGVFFLVGFQLALAQPTIISTVPINGATGVSTSAPVVFTFSTGMDTTATTAEFIDLTTPGFPTVIPVWSAGNTVLTCTPSPAFPLGHTIEWVVSGQDTNVNSLGGTPYGTFTAGTGGGGGGSGTNAVTGFLVGKAWEYDQTSASVPLLDTNIPYVFSGETALASNRTATTITLTLPTGGVSNLVQNFLYPWNYYLAGYNTNLTTFNETFSAGNYIFNVYSNAADQQVTVNLPNYAQPNAPQVSNYAAAQTINPSLPFTLTWNAFTGGGSTDYVSVTIGGTLFQTPGFDATNALPGTATSAIIPANTLSANSNYLADLAFYHFVNTTNGSYVTLAYVASLTSFNISTVGSSAAAPVFTNAAWSGGIFGFNVLTSPGQTVTVIHNTSLSGAYASWPILLTTNSPGSIFHVSDPQSAANKTLFYRARNGP
jgi:hypothetical protein